jgi:hypothetical protein
MTGELFSANPFFKKRLWLSAIAVERGRELVSRSSRLYYHIASFRAAGLPRREIALLSGIAAILVYCASLRISSTERGMSASTSR